MENKNITLTRINSVDNILLDIEERNDELKNINIDIIQLQQIFIDLQSLINEQQDCLNTIELNIEETKELVDKTEKDINEIQTYTYKNKILGGIAAMLTFFGIKFLY